jgi:uncharacterized coiled-coil DUF342 family protein
MAESQESTMARLDRLEASLAHLKDVLVLQSERMDIGFASLREELQANRQELRKMSDETRGMSEQTRLMVEQTRLMAEQTRAMAEQVHGLREETRATREETRTMRETLTDRLDRLIAITLKERTAGIERLANIEQRLARLEEHVGVTST